MTRTIVAPATPPGPARLGILRLSGPAAAGLLRSVLEAERPRFDPGRERQLLEGEFLDGRGRQPVRVLWMRGPRSYTREDVAELHLPGAEPLLAAALGRLLELGADVARPGEFTRRAFENGRIDLSQAEGVLALIEAGNEAERAAAAQLCTGGLERRTSELREHLLDLSSLCEASLDFDESDTGHVPLAELERLVTGAAGLLDQALEWEVARAAPAGWPRVFLVGAPNAGKSRLWNALTGGEALVGELAGTTRDSLEAPWALGATSCLLVDGPGLESPRSGPERSAQELYARRRAEADLLLWVLDAGHPERRGPAPSGPAPCLAVWNQIDRPGAAPVPGPGTLPAGLEWVAVSALQGQGLETLSRRVGELLGHGPPGEGGLARSLHQRHHAALRGARAGLEEARTLLAEGAPLDLVAEGLRAALLALGELAGRSTPEDVLDRIFARFCLGK